MILKNNIKSILAHIKEVNMSKLAKELNLSRAALYDLVDRDYLDDTKFINLVNLAKYVDVDIDKLYIYEDESLDKLKGEDYMKTQKIIIAGQELKKQIIKNNNLTNEKYINKMTSTFFNLQNAYQKIDKNKFTELLISLYVHNKLQIPQEIQDLMTDELKDEEWQRYAIAFTVALKILLTVHHYIMN